MIIHYEIFCSLPTLNVKAEVVNSGKSHSGNHQSCDGFEGFTSRCTLYRNKPKHGFLCYCIMKYYHQKCILNLNSELSWRPNIIFRNDNFSSIFPPILF